MKEINQNKFLFMFFRFIIFSVFISFVYIEIKYLYQGNLRFMGNKNVLDSLICAYGFSLMSIVAFDMAIYYVKIKKIKLFFMFILLFLVLFVFNVVTILYFKNFVYQDKIINSSENMQNKKNVAEYENIKEKIKMLKDNQKRIQSEYDRQFKILQSLKEDDKEYAFYYWNINRVNTGLNVQLNKITIELNKLNDDKNRIEINSDVLQSRKKELFEGTLLLLYLFLPAFIIELLASICMSLLLFIDWDVKKQNNIVEENISVSEVAQEIIKKEPEEKIKEVIKIQEIIKEVENPVNEDLKKKNELLRKQIADSEVNNEIDKLKLENLEERNRLLESNLKRFSRH